MLFARGYGEGKVESYCLMGQKVMEKDDGDDCTIIVTRMYRIVHSKRVKMVKFMLCRYKEWFILFITEEMGSRKMGVAPKFHLLREIQFSNDFFERIFFFMWTILKSLMNLWQYNFCFVFWFLGQEACGVLAPWPGIEPSPLALEEEVLTTGLHERNPSNDFSAHAYWSSNEGKSHALLLCAKDWRQCQGAHILAGVGWGVGENGDCRWRDTHAL